MSNKIKIEERPLAILRSFAGINDSMRLAGDKLFVRSDNSGTMGIFKPRAADLEITEEFSIGSVGQFLNVVGMCETPQIEMTDFTISIADKSKKFKYTTMPLDAISPLNMMGIELFQASSDVRMNAVLDEVLIKEISNAISKLDLNKVFLITDSDGKCKVKAVNESTDNSVEYLLDGTGTPDQEFEFGEIGILSSLYEGIYNLDVRIIDANGTDKPLACFVNKSLTEESLFYIVGME